MAKAFVYSILAALLFTAHSTTAFTLNIHDKMTEAERLVFGLDDSGPMYNVFPMSLTGMKLKRKARDDINCTLVFNGETIKLNLKPTSQYLATRYIPVWSADSDLHAHNKINYTPLLTAMRDIGEFTMYRDSENKAALVVYTDRSEQIVIEGIISSRYIIRSLPKRLIGELLNVVGNISKIPDTMGGTITSNEDAGFYAVIIIPSALAEGPYHRAEPQNAARQKRANRNEVTHKVPNKIYPEILIVLDHNAIRHRTITQALRFTLAFWNALAMLVRSLDKPKVRLNIAGIIIAKDDKATPYITEDTSVSSIGNLNSVIWEMQKYFYEERDRFPVNQYDIIVAMTTMTLCPVKNGSCHHSGFAPLYGYPSLYCSSERDIMWAKAVKNIMMMYYDRNFGPAHLFSFWDVFMNLPNPYCVSANRHPTIDDNIMQSECRQDIYSAIFASAQTECYRNKPRSIQPVAKVMPGRWLSMDGQCQNEGFSKSCKLGKKIEPCMAKGCRAKGSKSCVRSKKVPLLGSKCGTNMHCSKNKICVKK